MRAYVDGTLISGCRWDDAAMLDTCTDPAGFRSAGITATMHDMREAGVVGDIAIIDRGLQWISPPEPERGLPTIRLRKEVPA